MSDPGSCAMFEFCGTFGARLAATRMTQNTKEKKQSPPTHLAALSPGSLKKRRICSYENKVLYLSNFLGEEPLAPGRTPRAPRAPSPVESRKFEK